jgi:hypothetical protein
MPDLRRRMICAIIGVVIAAIALVWATFAVAVPQVDAEPPATVAPRCAPAADIARVSSYFGAVVIIVGPRAELLVDRAWQMAGRGEAPSFRVALVVVFHDGERVAIAPVIAGVSCDGLVIPRALWDAAVESLSAPFH